MITLKAKQFYLIALLVVTTVSILPLSGVSGASSTPRPIAGTSASLSYIELQESRLVSTIDSKRAISLATSSPSFQSKIAGATYQFNSIYEEFTWSPSKATTSVVMNTVNVVYSHRNTDGTGTNVVAIEDTGLTLIVGLIVQSEVTTFDLHYSGNWDGWEFSTGYGLFEATAYWSVPQAYVPLNSVTGSNCNNYWPYNNQCDFAPWVGITQNAAGSCTYSTDGCIVQGGTQSGQSCGCCGCGPNNGGVVLPLV